MFYKEDTPRKPLTKYTFPGNVEGLFVELNFRKSKWLLFDTYHPPTQNDQYFLTALIKLLILTVIMIMFYWQDILMQKMMALA